MYLRVTRALGLGAVGAVAAALAVLVAYRVSPALVLEMDRGMPQITSGFYPVERQGDRTFAWTSPRAVVRLPGLDRRGAWQCVVRLRGARPPTEPQPLVDIAIDDASVLREVVSNEFQDLLVTVPARPAEAGLTLAISSAPVFVPGPSDRRQLGVQVDRFSCQPMASAWTLPPRRSIITATVSGALVGAAFSLVGDFPLWALGAVLLVAIGQSIPLTAGAAPYTTSYQTGVVRLAFWIMAPLASAVTLWERHERRSLTAAARLVVLCSGAVLFLKLLALLHPSKSLVDALFHAHRLDWVLAGRYFFTQPMPSGVQFPYAIALYVFAAPWAAITSDHVTLLRVVVCAAQAFAGALLYPMVLHNWDDRRAAVTAVVLFHAVPLPYVIIGNANLTHAFGQAAALVALAAATGWSVQGRTVLKLVGLSALIAIAFLSHVGAFPLLLSTLVLMAVLYRVIGGAPLAAPARALLLATTVAMLASVATYYGHFPEVYKTLGRVRAQNVAARSDNSRNDTGLPTRQPQAAATSWPHRITGAATLGVEGLGWPIIVLAAVGAWRMPKDRTHTRLACALLASGLTCLLFIASSVMAPVAPALQRYTDEFVLRVYDATIPAVVVLAAGAVSWAWSAGRATRIAAGTLFAAAVIVGMQQWVAWVH